MQTVHGTCILLIISGRRKCSLEMLQASQWSFREIMALWLLTTHRHKELNHTDYHLRRTDHNPLSLSWITKWASSVAQIPKIEKFRSKSLDTLPQRQVMPKCVTQRACCLRWQITLNISNQLWTHTQEHCQHLASTSTRTLTSNKTISTRILTEFSDTKAQPEMEIKSKTLTYIEQFTQRKKYSMRGWSVSLETKFIQKNYLFKMNVKESSKISKNSNEKA